MSLCINIPQLGIDSTKGQIPKMSLHRVTLAISIALVTAILTDTEFCQRL
jgi:hypothetical protein